MLNPLDKPGDVFDLALLNPNPSSSKTKDGPVYRVSFELTQDDWQMFMDAETKGMMIACKCTVVRNDQGEKLEQSVTPKPGKGPYGKQSQYLISQGFFNVHQVLDALGGDEAYQAWCRYQPCVISGDYDYIGNVQSNVYAHVRRAENAGTGYKPKYSGVPMQDMYHRAVQHQSGELAAYKSYLGANGKSTNDATLEEAKAFFNRKAAEYLFEWATSEFKRRLGIDSMTWAEPGHVRAMCNGLGIGGYLPKGY